jgi:hypothetical protein
MAYLMLLNTFEENQKDNGAYNGSQYYVSTVLINKEGIVLNQ